MDRSTRWLGGVLEDVDCVGAVLANESHRRALQAKCDRRSRRRRRRRTKSKMSPQKSEQKEEEAVYLVLLIINL